MSEFFTYSKTFSGFFSEFGEKIVYEKGHNVVWNKDKSTWVFFQETGVTRVACNFKDDEEQLIGYFLPGMVFAQSGSFISGHNRYLSYVTETKSVIYRMNKQTFLNRLERDPILAHEYLGMTLRNQIFLVDRIIYQGEKGLRAKCIHWLLFMAKYYGKNVGNKCEIIIPITQETAAKFLNVTRESLNVVFRELTSTDYIEIVSKRISIKDLRKLRSLLD